MMHIYSWNVNGIRAVLKKGFLNTIQSLNPDLLCIQETKAQDEEVTTALSSGLNYYIISNSATRKGYSGTAVFSRSKPKQILKGIGILEHDQEGRVITTEFESFFLVNVYVPNAGRGLVRLEYRKVWDKQFLDYLSALRNQKPVVVCGDFNVAHQPIDLARPKSNYNKTAGYTQEEIDGFSAFLSSGFIDAFRHLYPEKVEYTWWSYMFNARQKNIGWRIDYFLVDENLLLRVKDVFNCSSYEGSDHCPIGLVLDV